MRGASASTDDIKLPVLSSTVAFLLFGVDVLLGAEPHTKAAMTNCRTKTELDGATTIELNNCLFVCLCQRPRVRACYERAAHVMRKARAVCEVRVVCARDASVHACGACGGERACVL